MWGSGGSPVLLSRPLRLRDENGAQVAQRPPEPRSEEHTSELQSLRHLVCRLLLEKKKNATRKQVRVSNNKSTCNDHELSSLLHLSQSRYHTPDANHPRQPRTKRRQSPLIATIECV